jgi:Domain of unknown function (DUF397)
MADQPNRSSSLTWRKSTISTTTNECVEIAVDQKFVLVRDSRNGAGHLLTFTRREWSTFLMAIRSGSVALSTLAVRRTNLSHPTRASNSPEPPRAESR